MKKSNLPDKSEKNMLIYVEECKITRKKKPIYEKKEDKFI